MLYHLLYPLSSSVPLFNVFKYITFRTGGAVMTALLVSFLVGPQLIRWLKSKQKKGQPIRDDGPQSHLITKQGTPTMGGVLILLALSVGTLLWADLTNQYVWAVLLVTLGFGGVGFLDDYLKVTKRNPKGFPGKLKLLMEGVIAGAAIIWIMLASGPELSGKVAIPLLKNAVLDFGPAYILFGLIVVIGAGNAVNLTDGLDGLATMPVIIAAATFALIAYVAGNLVFAQYLQLLPVPGSGELAVFCGAIVGAGLGFLWFNAPPAMVFMGDTGSLSLGGALGAVGVVTKHEIVLAIVGGLFVLETVSVVMQVASFKLTGKRVFRMAPLHHHYEEKGWAESTVVIRFWIIAVILAIVGLSTLKLR